MIDLKFAIVTPTIGTEYLQQCIKSVQEQTYENLTHYIFLDGEQYSSQILDIMQKQTGKKPIKTISLEENIGKGWYGHRVYAACSFLVNADVIVYLDEDNWIEPEHIENFAKLFQSKPDLQWAYSLRGIYNKEGEFLCKDNCESLGKWPTYFNNNVFHIDTSCYAVKTEIATKIGHAWFGQWGADRQFFGAIKQYFPNFSCSGKHSVCYRLDGNPNSVTKEFFDNGNRENSVRYNNNFPWEIAA